MLLRISSSQGVLQVVPPITVVAVWWSCAFSWKALFLLESFGDFIITYTQRSPGRGVNRVCSRWRYLSYLKLHSHFKFSSRTLPQTLFLPNHVGDLTEIHTQCSYGLRHLRVCSKWHTYHCCGYMVMYIFTKNAISPRVFLSNLSSLWYIIMVHRTFLKF